MDLRYPVQERKCQRTDEEKDRHVKIGEYKTRWYECYGDLPISVPPPEMTKHRGIRLGDLFCYWTLTIESLDPKMWLWRVGHDGRPGWSVVSVGEQRDEDECRLALTDNHRPSWVRDAWFRKKRTTQKLQRAHSERLSARMKSKGKGKYLGPRFTLPSDPQCVFRSPGRA